MYFLLALCLCLITVAIGGQDQFFFQFGSLSPPAMLVQQPLPNAFRLPLSAWPLPIDLPKIEELQGIKLMPPATAAAGPPLLMAPRLPIPRLPALAAKSTPIATIIRNSAAQHGLEERLILALVSHESGFNAAAVSSEGAKGLMQLMPGTAARLGVRNALDPHQNIAGGVKYLKMCLDRFNQDVALALAAYNAGPGNVEKYKGCPPFRETRQFVASVMEKCYGQDWRKRSPKPSS